MGVEPTRETENGERGTVNNFINSVSPYWDVGILMFVGKKKKEPRRRRVFCP